MERGLVMLSHSVLIAIVLYIAMVNVLKQKPKIAENRSILLGCLILIYMILFGHGLPNKLSKNI